MNHTTELKNELAAAQSRAQQLNAEAREARQRLNLAREALVEGTGSNGALVAAQSEADALNGAVEAIAQRIAAKLRELEAAEAGESRAAQLEELENGAAEFDAARTEALEIAQRLAGALAEMPQLYANLRRCDLLRMSLTGSATRAGLVEEFGDFKELDNLPLVALENEFLAVMPENYREAARQMLDKEREAFFSREKESWRSATGGTGSAISPGSLPSGSYQPRAAVAV